MNKSLVTNISAVLLIALGYFSPLYGKEIRTMGMYALSGAITNWLAIHMLFEKVPFLYGSGVILVRFNEFKAGIKNLVMSQFFTPENLQKFLLDHSSKGDNELTKEITDAIDMDKVFLKFKEAILTSQFGGMLNMFGGESILNTLKPQVVSKIKEAIEEFLADPMFQEKLLGQKSSGKLMTDINQVVEMRLNELTPKMVKKIVEEMIREHLGWLVVWGGVFGALIGLMATLSPLLK